MPAAKKKNNIGHFWGRLLGKKGQTEILAPFRSEQNGVKRNSINSHVT